jgi:dihydropteroate synthase
MGVVNVTPDSFSDGGRFLDLDRAVRHGESLRADGAGVIDVGGESTRPGASPVALEVEIERVVPVVERLRDRVVSVDTRNAAVAEAAIQAGARLVNDVSALRHDPEMAGVVASSGAGCVLMHMLGDDPRTMQDDPRYDDVVDDVKAFLSDRLSFAVAEGVPEERVWLDPGIGFGKTLEHNLSLLRRLGELCSLGRPLVVGASRKSFLGRLTGRSVAAERDAATVATTVLAYERGASVFRVHDVRSTVDALKVAAATVPRT